jgi:hypothetical protein
MSTENAFLCSICFQPISLRSCKTDERGRPVHEDCYAAKARYEGPSSRNNAPATGVREGSLEGAFRTVGRKRIGLLNSIFRYSRWGLKLFRPNPR